MLKKIIRKLAESIAKSIYPPVAKKNIDQISAVDKEMQILLQIQYKKLVANGSELPTFDDVEFRSFSQNGEDGILLYIFSLIGTTNKKCAEICAGTGIECNTANLIINHGWIGLLFDGDEKNVETGTHYYSQCPDTFSWPPVFKHAWINKDNINNLLKENGFSGPIDLLSLDLDGVDWWIWQAIDAIEPRVVVLEYNNLLGFDKSVTVPYSDNFISEPTPFGRDYAGASLSAFVKLGREKGYRLVGVQRLGFNAFFIKNQIGQDIFPEISASECFSHPFSKYAKDERSKNIQNKEWIEV